MEERPGRRATPRVSRSQFIRLGAVLGVGAAASAALAACGGSETGSGANGGSGGSEDPDATQAPQEGSVASGGSIVAEGEVAAGSAVMFEDGDTDAVLVHLESGEFVAYSAICTHQQCTVAYRDAQLGCPRHGSVFDPANGAQVLNGPAQVPCRRYRSRSATGRSSRRRGGLWPARSIALVSGAYACPRSR